MKFLDLPQLQASRQVPPGQVPPGQVPGVRLQVSEL